MTTITATGATESMLRWCERNGRTIERILFRGLAGLVAGYVVMLAAGPDGLITLGVIAALALLVRVGAAKLPQATGALVSTGLWLGALAILTAGISPWIPVFGLPEYVVTYPAGLIAILAAAYVMRTPGVHRGWTVAVSQAVYMLTLPLALLWPDNVAAGVAQLIGVIVGLGLVAWRDRKGGVRRLPEHRGLRLLTVVARRLSYIVIFGVVLFSAVLSNPGTATALSIPTFGLGDKLANMRDEMVCSFTSPDLTGESIGTGPESLMSNINLGKVAEFDQVTGMDTGKIPDWADQGNAYTRAIGPDYSMDSYTLYEIAGLRGLKWVNWQRDADLSEECGITSWMSVTVGNIIFKFSTYVLQVTIGLKEYSQVSDPLRPLYGPMTPMVSTMYTKFVAPMGAVMLSVAFISVIVRSAAGGFRQAIGEAGMSMVVLMVAAFMYTGITVASWANPNGNGFFIIASAADNVVGSMNSMVTEMIMKTIPGSESDMMCRNPADLDKENTAARGQRYSSCILAESMAYQPWAVGQFGRAGIKAIQPVEETTRFGNPLPGETSGVVQGTGLPCYNNYDNCSDMRSYLIAQEGGPSIQVARAECVGETEGGDLNPFNLCDPYYAVAHNLYTTLNSEESTQGEKARAAEILYSYKAQGSFPHISQAFAALFGSVLVALAIVMVAVVTLLWHARLFIAFLIGPLKLLWGAYPGKSRMAKEWGGEIMQSFAMRFLYGLTVTFMVAMLAVFFNFTTNTGLKLLWTVFVLMTFWITMRKIQEIAKPGGSAGDAVVRAGKQANGAMMTAIGVGGYGLGRRGGRSVEGPDPRKQTASDRPVPSSAPPAAPTSANRPSSRPATSTAGALGKVAGGAAAGKSGGTGGQGARAVPNQPKGSMAGSGRRVAGHAASGAAHNWSKSSNANSGATAAGYRGRGAATNTERGRGVANSAPRVAPEQWQAMEDARRERARKQNASEQQRASSAAYRRQRRTDDVN